MSTKHTLHAAHEDATDVADESPTREYEVGYGKTPVHSRFQKGQSGNPRGRKKGSKNGRTLLAEELGSSVSYVENGRRKTTTKLGLVIKQALNKAIKGEARELVNLIKCFGLDTLDQPANARPDALDSAEDSETQKSFFQRLRGEVP